MHGLDELIKKKKKQTALNVYKPSMYIILMYISHACIHNVYKPCMFT